MEMPKSKTPPINQFLKRKLFVQQDASLANNKSSLILSLENKQKSIFIYFVIPEVVVEIA